jgi:hypothetical protein
MNAYYSSHLDIIWSLVLAGLLSAVCRVGLGTLEHQPCTHASQSVPMDDGCLPGLVPYLLVSPYQVC